MNQRLRNQMYTQIVYETAHVQTQSCAYRDVIPFEIRDHSALRLTHNLSQNWCSDPMSYLYFRVQKVSFGHSKLIPTHGLGVERQETDSPVTFQCSNLILGMRRRQKRTQTQNQDLVAKSLKIPLPALTCGSGRRNFGEIPELLKH